MQNRCRRNLLSWLEQRNGRQDHGGERSGEERQETPRRAARRSTSNPCLKRQAGEKMDGGSLILDTWYVQYVPG